MLTDIPGRRHSKETRRKISEAMMGENNPMYGRERPDHSSRYLGPNNPMWKGDDVGYTALHHWIRNNKPNNGLCEINGCKRSVYDAACVTNIYSRDFSNWKFLCRSHHMKVDYNSGNRKPRT